MQILRHNTLLSTSGVQVDLYLQGRKVRVYVARKEINPIPPELRKIQTVAQFDGYMAEAVVHTRGVFSIHQRGRGGAPFSIQVGEQVIQTESAEDALSHVIATLKEMGLKVTTLEKMQDTIQQQELTSLSLQNMVNLILEQRSHDNDDHNHSQYQERLTKKDYEWGAHYYAKIADESVRKGLISALANTDTVFRLGFALKEKGLTGLIETDFPEPIANIILHGGKRRFKVAEKGSGWRLGIPDDLALNAFAHSLMIIYPAGAKESDSFALEPVEQGKFFRIRCGEDQKDESLGIGFTFHPPKTSSLNSEMRSFIPFSGPELILSKSPNNPFPAQENIVIGREASLFSTALLKRIPEIEPAAMTTLFPYLCRAYLFSKRNGSSISREFRTFVGQLCEGASACLDYKSDSDRPQITCQHASGLYLKNILKKSDLKLSVEFSTPFKQEVNKLLIKVCCDFANLHTTALKVQDALEDSEMVSECLQASQAKDQKVELLRSESAYHFNDLWRLIPLEGGTFKLVCPFLDGGVVMALGKKRHELSRWATVDYDLEKGTNWNIEMV